MLLSFTGIAALADQWSDYLKGHLSVKSHLKLCLCTNCTFNMQICLGEEGNKRFLPSPVRFFILHSKDLQISEAHQFIGLSQDSGVMPSEASFFSPSPPTPSVDNTAKPVQTQLGYRLFRSLLYLRTFM